MTVFVTKKETHFPQKYLAEWSIGNNGYSSWFYTIKEIKEYLASWNVKVIATNFKFR